MDNTCTIEYERTYLLKYVPNDLKDYSYEEIIDIYIPAKAGHLNLRIRKKDDKYEICKKYPVTESAASKQHEFTIPITKDEFEELNTSLKGKRARKYRLNYQYLDKLIEIDVFQDDLQGLILVDIEFSSDDEKANFTQPDFCLAYVTQEKVVAGGMIVGKKYSEIEPILAKYKYKPIFLN